MVIAVGGYIVIRTVETMGKICMKKIHNHSKKVALEDVKIYNITKSGISNERVKFSMSDIYRVIERKGDLVLVELIGKKNNPYFVSADFLSSISDFK